MHAIPVENPAQPGTPDVNYIEGWIELKWLRAWAKRATTVIHIDHWTRRQKIWHFRRRCAGGQAWVLLQCRREWLLFDGAVAALWLNRSTKAQLMIAAHSYWPRGMIYSELIEILNEPQAVYKPSHKDIELLRTPV